MMAMVFLQNDSPQPDPRFYYTQTSLTKVKHITGNNTDVNLFKSSFKSFLRFHQKKPIIIKNENCFKNGMFSFKTKVTIKSKWARKK